MKHSKKVIINTDQLDNYFTLVCEKIENLEKLTCKFEPKRQFIHTQVLHTKTQFLKFMQIVCVQMHNMNEMINHYKEKQGIKPHDLSEKSDLISKIVGKKMGG